MYWGTDENLQNHFLSVLCSKSAAGHLQKEPSEPGTKFKVLCFALDLTYLGSYILVILLWGGSSPPSYGLSYQSQRLESYRHVKMHQNWEFFLIWVLLILFWFSLWRTRWTGTGRLQDWGGGRVTGGTMSLRWGTWLFHSEFLLKYLALLV